MQDFLKCAATLAAVINIPIIGFIVFFFGLATLTTYGGSSKREELFTQLLLLFWDCSNS